LPPSRIKIRKSRRTLAYPSVRNTAILAAIIVMVGIAVAFVISQSSSGGGSLQVLVEPE